MKQSVTYQPLVRSILYVLLIGQLWVTIAPYCLWMTNTESELIELTSSEDNEKQEEDKKEKDDKIQNFLNTAFSEIASPFAKCSELENYLSINHQEVNTPPPEHFHS